MAALAVIGILVVIIFVTNRKPTYHGRTFTEWIDSYISKKYSTTSSYQHVAVDDEEAAIRAMGPNLVPSLPDMVQATDSDIKTKLLRLLSKQTIINVRFTTASQLRQRAHAAYQILGPLALETVPQLCRILTNSPSPQVRQTAASAIGWIGTNAQSAVPTLLISAKDNDDQVRNSSYWALQRLHPPLETVLPTLIAGLDDSFHVTRENAVIALVHYGHAASNAVPALKRMRDKTDLASLLRLIDPAAADEFAKEKRTNATASKRPSR